MIARTWQIRERRVLTPEPDVQQCGRGWGMWRERWAVLRATCAGACVVRVVLQCVALEACVACLVGCLLFVLCAPVV